MVLPGIKQWITPELVRHCPWTVGLYVPPKRIAPSTNNAHTGVDPYRWFSWTVGSASCPSEIAPSANFIYTSIDLYGQFLWQTKFQTTDQHNQAEEAVSVMFQTFGAVFQTFAPSVANKKAPPKGRYI